MAFIINSEYTDKTKWPARRKWRTESDFPSKESKETHITEIKNRADGQKVITFVSDHWTFEYDLAFSGLMNELVDAIVNAKYIEANRKTKKQKIFDDLSKYATIEEKSAYLYSYFADESTSKAEVAQQMAYIIETTYKNKPETLLGKLPLYIKDAINYVTEG